MYWNNWALRIREVLELPNSPIAVTYSDVPAKSGKSKKRRVCGALQNSAKGEIINLSKENSLCPGGSHQLGLIEHQPEYRRALTEFLTKGEKLFSCPISIYRMNALSKVKPPKDVAEYVVFSPLEKAEFTPDLIVFICNAWQAARLINLAYYQDGKPMECDPTGALCRSVITYPLVKGCVNISFGDVTARRMQKYNENELFISIPLIEMKLIMENIEFCSAGTAKTEFLHNFRKMIKMKEGEIE